MAHRMPCAGRAMSGSLGPETVPPGRARSCSNTRVIREGPQWRVYSGSSSVEQCRAVSSSVEQCRA
eukprot:4788009-Alexandrium_andersonii.AAC.1